MHGSCNLYLDCDGEQDEIILGTPRFGVFVPSMVWGVQYNFSADATLLVLTSHEYDEGDYYRSYADFSLAMRGSGK